MTLTSSTAGREVILSTMVWVASQGFFFFFFLCDGCSIRLLKTRTAFLCMGEKVGVGQDPASQCLAVFCFFSCGVPSERAHLRSYQHMEYNGIQWRGPGASSAFVKINGGKKKQVICVLGQHSDSNPEGTKPFKTHDKKGHISLACTLHASKTRAAGLN